MATKKVHKKDTMLEILAASTDFVIVDIETSGLSPEKGGRIIEIGAAKIKGGRIVETYQQFVYPEQKIYGQTIELTGITNEMLKGQPVIEKVLPDFHAWLEECTFVAHNAVFDWDRFLEPAFRRMGLTTNFPVVCTKVLASGFLELANNKLGTLCGYYGVTIENAHRAIDDAVALAKCLSDMKEELLADKPEVQSVYHQEELFDPEPEPVKYRIERVAHWEKKIGKNQMRRIYVTLNVGSVYYDLDKDVWLTKDIDGVIDMQELERRVLNFIGKSQRSDLLTFRGTTYAAS